MDFTEKFPLPHLVPSPVVRGMHNGSVLIDQDAMIFANIKGDVVVRAGANALVGGLITGSIDVEAGAVAYVHAIVKGNVTVRGAASIQGVVSGDVRVNPSATLALDGLDTIVSGTVSELSSSS
jgi:hypothetical protein